METVEIYLAGGLSGLSLQEQIGWRNRVQAAIKFSEFKPTKTPKFYCPPNLYSLSTIVHKSERDAMILELSHLRKSDLMIVNFHVPESIGTAMELMVAKENGIPIVGLSKEEYKLHPWILGCCSRVCDDMKELAEHIVEFYLN